MADSWLPSDAIRGELAESWKILDNPFRVEVKLRKGVMFPDKPGVMKARELVADDVVYSFYRLDKSPKKIPTYYDHVDKVEATDKYTVLFTFKNYNAEWDYRFGWGYYSGIVPKEVTDAGAKDWKNANGTGPFELTDYVQGNAATFSKNTAVLGQRDHRRPIVQAALRRQDRLPHDQGRSHDADRAAHRQARRAGVDPLERGRRAEEERAEAASGNAGSTPAASSSRCASTPSRSTTSGCAVR